MMMSLDRGITVEEFDCGGISLKKDDNLEIYTIKENICGGTSQGDISLQKEESVEG